MNYGQYPQYPQQPPPQFQPPQRPRPPVRRGIGCGGWLLLAFVGALTLGACVIIPQIGWTGWVTIGVIWFVLKHLENQQAIQASIEEQNSILRDAHGPYRRDEW